MENLFWSTEMGESNVRIECATLARCADALARIPELDRLSLGAIQERIGDSPFIALVARVDGCDVGCKLGYWVNDRNFYSWMGGVCEDFRRRGIADALLSEQEKRVVEIGGTVVTVKSMNRYPAMLVFLVTRGYSIVGYDEQSQKILFHKQFTNSVV